MGLGMKIIRHNPMSRRFDDKLQSYRVNKVKNPKKPTASECGWIEKLVLAVECAISGSGGELTV